MGREGKGREAKRSKAKRRKREENFQINVLRWERGDGGLGVASSRVLEGKSEYVGTAVGRSESVGVEAFECSFLVTPTFSIK